MATSTLSGCGGKSAVGTSDANAGATSTVANSATSATTSTGFGQGGAVTTLGASTTFGTDTAFGSRATTAVGGVMQTASRFAAGGTWSTSNAAAGGRSAIVGTGGNTQSTTGSDTVAIGGAGRHSSNTTAIEIGGTANDSSAANQAGAAGAAPVTECFPAILETPNVVVIGDASPSGADVEGILWVGGDADFDGYHVGQGNGPRYSCNDYGLVVGGDLSGGVVVGASASASVYGSTSYGGYVSACEVTNARVVDFDAVATAMSELSARLKVLPANGSTQRQAGALTFSGQSETLNVFSLTAPELLDIGMMKFQVPTSSTVLVNLSGESVLWGGMGFELPNGTKACRGGGTGCTKIFYNLYEATSLDLSGLGVPGSILAPKATLNGAGGNVDGQVFVGTLLGQIEYHPYLFDGCLR
jgi:choice-of-anchor A domain-containing protein